jgi:methionyl-tRNA synthetase
MSDKKGFYITTPIFYPNANLHMGHALVATASDILARHHREKGNETYFLTGSDDNTSKIIKSAEDANLEIPAYLSFVKGEFEGLFKDMNISYDQFISTSDKEVHWPGAIKMWNKLVEAGDIYPGSYEGLYCAACEAFYTEKDLVDGKCPIHGTTPEIIKEKNYFFKLSKYGDQIKQKIESNELEVIPETRKNEILAFLNRGLEDISFSRPKAVVPHGIPVPGDSDQVMYVWCDALVNYISALGYGREDDRLFKKFWPADYHVIGKDISRFHLAIWPGMLLAAGLPLPKKVLVHGFIISGGKKMSKTLGNVVDPKRLIKEYGTDALRYFLAREISLYEDSDMTIESFKDSYNGNLANGLGNLVSRIMKMATTYGVEISDLTKRHTYLDESLPEWYNQSIENFEIKRAMDHIWERINGLDQYIQETTPFKLIKTDEKLAKQIVQDLIDRLWVVGKLLTPFMPKTSKEIISATESGTMPQSLFQRKD